MKRLILAPLLLAGLALGGCSNMFAGMALGGAEGFDGPGAGAVKVTHTNMLSCPDIASQGSIPATGVALNCTVSPDGTRIESATVGNLDSTAILGQAMKAQADANAAALATVQQLAPLAAQAAATAAAGPVAGAAARAILTPKPAPLPSTTISGQGVQVQP